MTAIDVHKLFVMFDELHHDCSAKLGVSVLSTADMRFVILSRYANKVAFRLTGNFHGKKHTYERSYTFNDLLQLDIDTSNGVLYGFMWHLHKMYFEDITE